MTIYEEQLMLDLLKCNPKADKPAKTRRTFIDNTDGPITRQARDKFKMTYGYEPSERNLRIAISESGIPEEAKQLSITIDAALGSLTGSQASSNSEDTPSSFDELIETTFAPGWDKIRHFKRSEFACKCGKCGGFPVEPKMSLIEIADEMREHFNATITVTSGVRCAAHNLAVGGVANSRHKLGKAMDFCVAGVSGSIVKAYCDKLVKSGRLRYCYIISGNYVHMDVL